MPWTMELKMFCVKTYYKTKSSEIVQARYKRKFIFNSFKLESDFQLDQGI